MKNKSFCLGLLPLVLSSTPLMATQQLPTLKDDNLIIEQVPILQPAEEIGSPSTETKHDSSETQLPSVTDEDLKQHPELAEQIINQALIQQDWQTLQHLMSFYSQIPGHDPILAKFVQGALYRHAGQHQLAIALYRDILQQQPQLAYIRLDLAAMLFENKAYKDAQTELDLIKPEQISPHAQQRVSAYQAAIKQQQRWRVNLASSYGYNSNINNATSAEYIYLFGWLPLKRDKDSLPKSGHVLNLSLSANKDINLSGNHYAKIGVAAQHDVYKNYPELHESNFNFTTGYKYQNIRSWLEVSPWLKFTKFAKAGTGNIKEIGVSSQYGRWLNNKWQWIVSYNIQNRSYDRASLKSIYNGHIHSNSMVLAYLINPNLIVYSNTGWQKEKLKQQLVSSTRYTQMLGFNGGWQQGVQSTASVAYSYRKYDGIPTFSLERRKDRELQVNLSLWHNRLQLYGVTPKLNLRYSKTNSNIYLYDKNKKEINLQLEKQF